MDRLADNRSVGELLTTLSAETTMLIRQEVALARAELTRNLNRVSRHAAAIAAGGAIAYAGLLGLVATLILGLVRVGMTPWLAALIGSLAVLGIGYATFQYGLSALRHDQIAPEATLDSMKENAQWAKDQLK